MIRKFFEFFYLIIFFLLVGCSPKEKYSKEIIEIDKLVLNTLKTNNLPGISVTILKNGKNIYSKGFGYSDINKKIKILPSKTRFRIGSFSKTLAASALMKLVEEGKIDLDVSIYDYVPDYPKKRWDFTSRQIAGHLSGIRSYKVDEMMINKNFSSVKDALSVFKMDSLAKGLCYSLNIPLISGTKSHEFLNAYESIFKKLKEFRPEFILLSAGFDAHKDDPLAQINLESEDYYTLTKRIKTLAKELCDEKVVSILEGGYDLNALRESVNYHIKSLMED